MRRIPKIPYLYQYTIWRVDINVAIFLVEFKYKTYVKNGLSIVKYVVYIIYAICIVYFQ